MISSGIYKNNLIHVGLKKRNINKYTLLILILLNLPAITYGQGNGAINLIRKYEHEKDLNAKQFNTFKLCDYYIEYDVMDSAQLWLSRAKIAASQLSFSKYNYLLYTRQAEIYYYQHLYDLGLQTAKNGFTTAVKLNDSAFCCDAKFFEAIFNLEMDSIAKAKELFTQSLNFYPKNKIGEFGFSMITPSQIYNNIAECYLGLNLPDSALLYNNAAYADAVSSNSQRGLSITFFTYGEINRIKAKYDSADFYFKKCLNFNKSLSRCGFIMYRPAYANSAGTKKYTRCLFPV
jgi:hypothetical protein